MLPDQRVGMIGQQPDSSPTPSIQGRQVSDRGFSAVDQDAAHGAAVANVRGQVVGFRAVDHYFGQGGKRVGRLKIPENERK